VLKKAGIVVATAAAGLLAVSPLAFAGDKDDHDHHRENDRHKSVKVERVKRGDHFEGTNQAEQGLVARPVAINICNNGDFGDDYWGAASWLQPPTSVEEDRNCYQRAESSVDAEQDVDQSNEND
jgi:hypothetical protein